MSERVVSQEEIKKLEEKIADLKESLDVVSTEERKPVGLWDGIGDSRDTSSIESLNRQISSYKVILDELKQGKIVSQYEGDDHIISIGSYFRPEIRYSDGKIDDRTSYRLIGGNKVWTKGEEDQPWTDISTDSELGGAVLGLSQGKTFTFGQGNKGVILAVASEYGPRKQR